jgi:hypothetical protein
LVIAAPTIDIFMAGGLLSLIWCALVLVVCWKEGFPVTSLFPEVDFASKVAGAPKEEGSLPVLLSDLSQQDSKQIRADLNDVTFYMYAKDDRMDTSVEQGEQTSLPSQGVFKWE